MMRRAVLVVAALVAGGLARAQTHAVKKPETVVRAIAVYEWTGDEAKPTASRLVPVSIFINSQMEDAGVYMARPVPFALDRGTIFEAQQAGEPKGTLELAYQRHVEGANGVAFDDGWLGYGAFKPAKTESTPVLTARKNQPLPQVVTSGRPHFSSNTDSSGATTTTADDSSRPTMKRRDSDTTSTTSTSTSGSGNAKTPAGTTSTAATTPAKDDDPDRPVLTRRDGSSDTTADSTAASTPTSPTATPAAASTDDSNRPTMRRRTSDSTDSTTTSSTGSSDDDTDRPTLKKRTPAQAKNAKRPGDTASVQSASNLNDDPDRPTLHRGSTIGPEIPPLNGLPKDMRQMVAVSDAKDRPAHDFTRPWDSDEERAEVLAKMQEAARARLASYDVPAPAPAATAPAAAPAAKKTTTARAKKPAAPPPPPPPTPVELDEESLRGYTLSYGGAATFVYSASSPGVGGATRYVSVVAQKEPLGELKTALASVTDSGHLDRTPWMRLVDVVDAEASNRASLLFEMRAQNVRQFALYRVIGARAEQVFSTGTTE
jgi:hypothetical protein